MSARVYSLRTVSSLAKGFASYLPGANALFARMSGGETHHAVYCYGVWLKHLTLLWEGGTKSIPNSLAELGPGYSLGVGLAALLSGVNRYYALDTIRHENLALNLRLLDDLIVLFQMRASRPTRGWPDFDPFLDNNLFPSHILTEERLHVALNPVRLESIRTALVKAESAHSGIAIQYFAPWTRADLIDENSVDAILSHSVLEHVVEIDSTYRALAKWLKPGGVMTHQIDYTSHGTSSHWNGHRAYPDWVWRRMIGKRTALINSVPHSAHLRLIRDSGVEIFCNFMHRRNDGISREKLSSQWEKLSDEDFNCAGGFVQARKV